ncbi:hypothetical protein BDB01DRAFT_780215 [Pilobolus umbonatus]|nr:hypothetical protein BDB01DRAFT_780215 [Pilobolus umbonatus]
MNSQQWKKPLTQTENLEGSVKYLEQSIRSLKTTVETLTSVTTEYNRQTTLVENEKKYELLTENDIQSAELKATQILGPQMEIFLSNIPSLLSDIQQKEKESSIRVEEHRRKLSELKANTEGKTAAGHERPLKIPRIEGVKKNATTLEELTRQRKRLKQLVEQTERECKKESTQLNTVFKYKNELESVRQRKLDISSSIDKHVSLKDKIELEQKSRELDKLITLKQSDIRKKQQQLDDNKRQKSVHKEAVSDQTEYIKSYKEQLQFIEDFKSQISQPSFTSNISTVKNCIHIATQYAEQLKDEKQSMKGHDNHEELEKYISQLTTLCSILMPDNNQGKTVGRILEVMIRTSRKAISSDILMKEYPSRAARRHVANALILLLMSNIIEIIDNDICLCH